MADLIRCGSNSYNLIIIDKVVEVTRFTGLSDMMDHIVILKSDPDEPKPKHLSLPSPGE
jgi:hypothetical protein